MELLGMITESAHSALGCKEQGEILLDWINGYCDVFFNGQDFSSFLTLIYYTPDFKPPSLLGPKDCC